MLTGSPYPVYGGVREDGHVIGGGGSGAILIVDVPFSFAADTLLLPLGLYNLRLLPPSVDPLKDWRSWTLRDEELPPADDRFGNTLSKNLPVEHPSLDGAIKEDYQKYLNKHEPNYFESGPSTFYEDGTGQHAVRLRVGRDGYYWIYTFIYNKSNARTKIFKYANGRYAC
jgi:hypothetical protein